MEFIVYIILALVGVMLATSLFMNFPSVMNNIHCFFYKMSNSIFPKPDYMRSPPPPECVKEHPKFETIDELSSDPDKIATDIAAYSLACWEQGKRGFGDKEIFCYEIYILKDPSSSITEDMIKSKLQSYDYIIIWKNPTISKDNVIAIYYKPDQTSDGEGRIILE